ncbi:trans-sialidase [Trypanosoma cruzi cruzi]|nr:trans-sialidase [Trypanosoma cruzi cruzi]
MLSRIAAVKAPRTHNRRRVTGSSGMMREGRESEPPRPNMSRHLFYSAALLIFLVMVMFCGTGGASAEVKESASVQFKWEGITDVKDAVKSLGVPGLLKVENDVFAVAEARCKKEEEENTFTGIASQILTETGNKPKEVLKDAKKEIQVLEKDASQGKKKEDVSRPTTFVQGSEIYMLVGKCSRTAVAQESVAEASGLFLVKGEVSGDGSDKNILWKDTKDVPRASFGKDIQSLEGLIGGGGSGVKRNDDTLVFPVEGTKSGEDGKKKTVSLLIYSKDANSWTVSKWMSAEGCSDPSVVEWKDKLMMMTACDDGRRRVYESGDKGDSWTEALGTLSRVWVNPTENERDFRSGFITATFGIGDDKKEVMLVTLPVYAKKNDKGGNEKGVLRLWLTDNTHIVDIGSVSGDDEDAAASSLLYKSVKSGTNNEEKDELIALYEKKGDETTSPSLWSVRLTDQLERVKEVLATWKKVDKSVSQLCPTSSATVSKSPKNACSTTFKVTDGLVGFLSGDFSEDTWRDEYLGVNATVKGNDGEKKKAEAATVDSEKGVRFQGAWAEWPVGSQGENQLYHFANYKFTLVATVSIYGEPQEGDTIPLMGVKMNDEQRKSFGLSYEKGKWRLLCSDGPNSGEQSRVSEPDKTQHVVILLRNGTQGSAYVDGQPVGGDTPCALGNTDSKGISHFYIGGDGDKTRSQEGVSMTVTNVLLYNRPLSSEEIGAFNPNKDSTPPLEENPSKPSSVSSASIVPPIPPVTPNAQQTETPSTPAGKHPTEQGQSMESSGAGSGGAFASAVSTVSTPSAEEESVVQVTSGTSPDGNQTVGGGSTADGEPTMRTREGGTNGQEVNTQVGELNASALNSSLGNVSQGNNSDAGKMRGSGLLPSLLLLLLGLWGFAVL